MSDNPWSVLPAPDQPYGDLTTCDATDPDLTPPPTRTPGSAAGASNVRVAVLDVGSGASSAIGRRQTPVGQRPVADGR